MPDKGEVERFIRYSRHSFYVQLTSRLAQDGLIVDCKTANLAAKRLGTRSRKRPHPRHHRRNPGRAAGAGAT